MRGYTIVAALLDELAFWLGEDSSNPDFEIITAIRPAMSTIPNAMLLCASSPYAGRARCGRPIIATSVTMVRCLSGRSRHAR